MICRKGKLPKLEKQLLRRKVIKASFKEALSKIIQSRLNRGCLFYMFSLRFSRSKFLINLRPQLRVSKSLLCTLNFLYTSFCGICSLFILCLKLLFRLCVTYYLGCSFTEDCSLTGC